MFALTFCNIVSTYSDESSSSNTADDEEYHDAVRPITMEDLLKSFKNMRLSKLHTGIFGAAKPPELD